MKHETDMLVEGFLWKTDPPLSREARVQHNASIVVMKIYMSFLEELHL
jgi:hypothetical protein